MTYLSESWPSLLQQRPSGESEITLGESQVPQVNLIKRVLMEVFDGDVGVKSEGGLNNRRAINGLVIRRFFL